MNTNKLFYTSYCLLSIVMMAACGNLDEGYKDKIPGLVSVGRTGFNVLESYNVGDPYEIELCIAKAGILDQASAVSFTESRKLLDSVNLAGGTNYQMLPSDCYEMSQSNVALSTGVDRACGKIRYFPDKIVAKGSNYGTVTYVLPLIAKSDGLPMNTERSSVLYGVKVLEPIVRIKNYGFYETSVNNATGPVSLPAQIYVDFSNKWDIGLTLESSQAKVDEYNTANNSYYSLLPSGVYSMNPSNPVLETGKSETTISFQLDQNKLQPGNYLLPVKLSAVSRFKIDSEKDEIIHAVSYLGDILPKSDWTITANTEERTGEGTNNGMAVHMIDGDASTFWHSRWDGGRDPLPFEITIDMKKEVFISQIELTRRNNNSDTKLVIFETSLNGNDWVSIGEFTVIAANGAQLYRTKTGYARYLKVIVPNKSPQTNNVASIAELNVRGFVK